MSMDISHESVINKKIVWSVNMPSQGRTNDTFVDRISYCLNKLRRGRVVIYNKFNQRQNSLMLQNKSLIPGKVFC